MNNTHEKQKLLTLATILETLAISIKEIVLAMTPEERQKLNEKIKNNSNNNLLY